MIFPIIFFLISAILGYRVLKFVSNSFNLEEATAAGLLIGSTINIVLTFLLANLFSFSLFIIIFTQVVLLIVSAVFYFTQKELQLPSSYKIRLSLLFLSVVGLIIFIPLFTSHMLLAKNGDYYTGGFTYGDLAFHTTLINSFVYGDNFPPQNPVFSGTRLSYPPAIDFLSAMFMLTGSNIQQSLYIPGLVYVVTIIIMAFLLAYQLTKNLIASFLTPLLLIFNGGIGFFYFLLDMQQEGKDILSALTTMTKEYAHLMDYNIRFSNIVADYLLPQRTFLIGFPIGILILILIFKYFDNKDKGSLVIAGFLSGLLPIIHPHSLIAIGIVASFLIIINLSKENLINHVKYFATSFLIFGAISILWILSSKQVGTEFFRIKLFWMAGEENPIWFYYKNLGLVLPLTIIALFTIPRHLLRTYSSFAVIFVITNIFIFQPHDYDNMKIMLYWFLGTVIIISFFLFQLWQKRSLITRTMFNILLFFLIITGVLSVLRESYSQFPMYDKEGLDLALQVKNFSDPDDIILTSDQHNHPITSFAGRSVVMGYRGWLWTWGYDYRERERDVLDIYQGLPSAKELIKKYNIALIVIGPSERSQFLANESYFDQNFRLLLRAENYKVYDARNI